MMPSALRDLADARTWLTQLGAGRRAFGRLAAIARAIEDLRIYSCRWPRGDRSGTREQSVEGYRIVYRAMPDNGDDQTAAMSPCCGSSGQARIGAHLDRGP